MSVPRLRVALVAKRALAALPGLRAAGAVVCAVCETDPQQLARMGEACGLPESRRLSDYADVLCSEADAVVVGTPMHLHAPQAIAALEAGRHVMSAVTAAVSLDQCRALAAACERARAHGLVYMMDENACFRRHTVLIRSLVRRGAFGDVYYAEGEYLHDVKHLHHGPDGAPTWRSTWQVGRNGCTYGTHSLGPILQWLQGTSTGYPDPIASVSCLGSGRHTDPEHAMEDTVVMLCKLASGRLARVRVDMLSNRPQAVSNYTLQGTEGAYESQRASGERHRVWLSTRRERSWQELDDFADPVCQNGVRVRRDEADRFERVEFPPPTAQPATAKRVLRRWTVRTPTKRRQRDDQAATRKGEGIEPRYYSGPRADSVLTLEG